MHSVEKKYSKIFAIKRGFFFSYSERFYFLIITLSDFFFSHSEKIRIASMYSSKFVPIKHERNVMAFTPRNYYPGFVLSDFFFSRVGGSHIYKFWEIFFVSRQKISEFLVYPSNHSHICIQHDYN